MIFKYEDYKTFLRHIKECYSVMPLGNWDGSNGIILRHDVDLDIKPAYKLALIENEFAIPSTYFILTTGQTYNPMSSDNRKMLKEMSDMGFEIALHFDPSIYEYSELDFLTAKVEQEVSILSSITDKAVKSISLHNPGRFGTYPLFDGYCNAYDERIFSTDTYISDSRMQFQKDIYTFVKKAKERTIQILLHPSLYTEDGSDYGRIFYDYLFDFINKVDAHFDRNSTYRACVKESLFNHLIRMGREESSI